MYFMKNELLSDGIRKICNRNILSIPIVWYIIMKKCKIQIIGIEGEETLL